MLYAILPGLVLEYLVLAGFVHLRQKRKVYSPVKDTRDVVPLNEGLLISADLYAYGLTALFRAVSSD